MFKAAVMDGGVFLMINVLILFCILSQRQFSFENLQWVLMTYALGLFLINVYWWQRFRSDYSWLKYRVCNTVWKTISTFILSDYSVYWWRKNFYRDLY